MKLPSQKTIDQWNEQVRITRAMLYRQNSDEWFIAWQKYLALGDEVQAVVAKQRWLDAIQDIDLNHPYYNIETVSDEESTETKKVSTETVEKTADGTEATNSTDTTTEV